MKKQIITKNNFFSPPLKKKFALLNSSSYGASCSCYYFPRNVDRKVGNDVVDNGNKLHLFFEKKKDRSCNSVGYAMATLNFQPK